VAPAAVGRDRVELEIAEALDHAVAPASLSGRASSSLSREACLVGLQKTGSRDGEPAGVGGRQHLEGFHLGIGYIT